MGSAQYGGSESRSFGVYAVGGAILAFVVVLAVLFHGTRAYVLDKAHVDIENMLLQHKGVHQYVQKNAHPDFYRLRDAGEIPLSCYSPTLLSSSYMVRNMHNYYNDERGKVGRPALYYKMAADNPRNPVNRASASEAALIELFNRRPDLKEVEEIVEIDGQKHLYVALPFLPNTEACLKCHGRPEDAPPGLRKLYPEEGGYGEKLGRIRAIESLRAPLQGEMAVPYVVLIAASLVGLGTLGLLGLNRRLRTVVARNTAVIAEQAGAVRRVAEDLRITLDSIGDAVIATDVHGKIARMNPVAERLTGWSAADAIGRPLPEVFRIVQAQTRQPSENPVEQVLATGEVVALANHTVLIAKNGTEFQIADSGAPIRNDKGAVVGVVLVFRDVTERYALEEKLRHSQKMEAVGQLAGGVAHDFNNMLAAILGAADLMAIKIPKDDLTRKYVDIVAKSAERAAELTRKLLAFSRKGEVETVVVDMHQVIRDVVTMLEHTADKRVRIETSLTAEPSTVMGDFVQLQSALLNLGVNACHAMPEGGSLTFSTRLTELDPIACRNSAFALKSGWHIEVDVRDTGCGIPVENIGKVFDPFFTTKEVGKGTGLGLAAVYGTVMQHDGSVTVYSEVGRGTVFHVLLPVVGHRAATTEPTADIVRGSGTILLIDDEEAIRVGDSGRVGLPGAAGGRRARGVRDVPTTAGRDRCRRSRHGHADREWARLPRTDPRARRRRTGDHLLGVLPRRRHG